MRALPIPNEFKNYLEQVLGRTQIFHSVQGVEIVNIRDTNCTADL